VIVAGLAVAGALCAQDAAVNSPAALQENAAKRTTEWTTFATNLEPRLARLLPCDPRVRTSVEEVSRASDARIVALTSYWTVVSIKSKQQIDAVRQLLAQEEGRVGDGAKDQADAQAEVTAINAKSAALGTGLQQLPALANPQKNLQSIAQMYRTLEQQAQGRETSMGEILDGLREQLRASHARQAAIEDHLKAISMEGERWSGYYAARQARAQIECSLINPAAATPLAPAPPAARPVPPAKKP
jgi:chromosome segregation ATPase